MPSTAAAVKRELKAKADPTKAAFYPKFFKAAPGEYAHGDQFLGVVVPEQRKIARTYRELPRAQVDKLLDDRFHECRLTALLILVLQYQRARTREERMAIVDYYLSRTDAVNNWDLVDTSAYKILGASLVGETDHRILDKLANSGVLWEQRIAMIATYALIKSGELAPTLKLATKFLDHPHDLMHKASGWMLRELGKQDCGLLRAFLDEHAARMPRTMLRYAIEKLPTSARQSYLAGASSARQVTP